MGYDKETGDQEELRRENKLRSMADILPTLYRQKKWQQGWLLFQLSQEWPEIVGQQVAALTRPAWFRHNVLWIYVQNSAWIQHIHLVKLDLLTRIQQTQKGLVLGDIRCLVDPEQTEDPAQAAKTKEKQEQRQELSPEQLQYIRQLTENIGNTECRRAVRELWQRWLERQPQER